MRNPLIAAALAALLALSYSNVAVGYAEKMVNQDVIDLLAAGIAESTVVKSVSTTPSEFDVSPQGLIALSKAGVPKAVIEAMIGASGNASDKADSADRINPEEVILVSGDSRQSMRYVNPTVRTAARAMGWGGLGSYSVLNGPRANLRITDVEPGFIVAVPGNAQPESYVTLVNLAIRRNNTREVMIGGGYMSYSTGIHKDRVVATVGTELADQSQAPEGFRLYELKPQAPLPAGEYAIVFYSSQVNVFGFFARGGDSYFDFGVDR